MQLTMKILKIVAIISFLLICSTDQKGFPVFIMLMIYLVDFFQSFTYNNLGISWSSFTFTVLTIGTLIIFFKCKKFQDRYLQLFSFLVLLISIVVFFGILNVKNLSLWNLYFLLPFLVFIMSSIILILIDFEKILLHKTH